jgi:anti-sigma regulatory factor (Ser/Thr protein kinase)
MTAETSSATTRRSRTLTLPALPAAAPCARTFVRHTLHHWHLAHLAETAQLLTSELVTNAVQATGTTADIPAWGTPVLIQVRLTLTDTLVVGVWDRDPTPPAPRAPDPDAEGGRGLSLVEHLSTRWGYHHPATGGKVIWCELDTATPTTNSGLPIRTPANVPAQRTETFDDLAALQRVLDGLRRL